MRIARHVPWFASVLLLAGCATTPGDNGLSPASMQGEAEAEPVRWVAGPEEGISTLMLDPVPVTLLRAEDGSEGPLLSLGAFFAQWVLEDARLDQLSLMVQMVGEDLPGRLGENPTLFLEVDGEILAGTIGTTGNCFQVDDTPAGQRVTLVMEIDPDRMEQLMGASRVRASIGPWGEFEISAPVRERFAMLLDRIPGSNSLDWDRNTRNTVALLGTD